MAEQFDFIVAGGGSAGAVIASRLSEDRACRVALIEAGERPPEISALPIAPPAMQLNPTTDWMFTWPLKARTTLLWFCGCPAGCIPLR
jgi:choline dehydrogenase